MKWQLHKCLQAIPGKETVTGVQLCAQQWQPCVTCCTALSVCSNLVSGLVHEGGRCKSTYD